MSPSSWFNWVSRLDNGGGSGSMFCGSWNIVLFGEPSFRRFHSRNTKLGAGPRRSSSVTLQVPWLYGREVSDQGSQNHTKGPGGIRASPLLWPLWIWKPCALPGPQGWHPLIHLWPPPPHTYISGPLTISILLLALWEFTCVLNYPLKGSLMFIFCIWNFAGWSA